MVSKAELPFANDDLKGKVDDVEALPFRTIKAVHTPRSRIGPALRVLLAICCTVVLTSKFHFNVIPKASLSWPEAASVADICPQAQPLEPLSALMAELDAEYATEEFKASAIEALSGAVKIP